MIPEEKIRQVAERASIYEIASEYVQLRKTGVNFTGLCPFHSEKTPSFNVNPVRESYYCFGCGAGGDVFSFVMKIEGVAFPEAVKILAKRVGIEIEERHLTPLEKQKQGETEALFRINRLAADFYSSQLKRHPDAENARNYLKKRNAGGEIADIYSLGFAPERGDALFRHLKGNGVEPELAQKLGLIRKGDRGWYDQFRGRLMFPIRDIRGRVIAFAGRVLDSSLPKYINSPESPLYHKGSVLFGMDIALPSVRHENSLIIVEGYFDHLALFRSDIRNVAATCGTALTPAHASLIKRHAAKVYLLFDGDAAGRKATVRAMEIFLEQQIPAYVINLPDGEDPDTFLSVNPAENFNSFLKKGKPAFEQFIKSTLRAFPPDSVDNKIRALNEITPLFRKITAPVERDLYEKEICRLMGITAHAFRKQASWRAPAETSILPDRTEKSGKADRWQETLLLLIWSYPEARPKIVEAGIENLFEGDYLLLARIIMEIAPDRDGMWRANRLADSLDSAEAKRILARILVSDSRLADVDWSQVLDNCMKGRELRKIGSIKNIAVRLASLEPGSEEYDNLLLQADLLRNRKSKL